MEHTKKAQSEAFQKKELELQRSEFDMSHKNVMTCNFNKIIPINQAECMPGDKWKFDIDFFSRWLKLQVITFLCDMSNSLLCNSNSFFWKASDCAFLVCSIFYSVISICSVFLQKLHFLQKLSNAIFSRSILSKSPFLYCIVIDGNRWQLQRI